MTRLRRLPDWTARIIVRSGKGLLSVRVDAGEWHLPGGKKDPEDSSPLCTAKRELTEETGLPSEAGTFTYLFTRPSKQGKKNRYDIHYYEAFFPPAVIETHLKAYGEHGEETSIISYKRLRTVSDFNTAQLSMVRRLKRHRPPNTSTRSKSHDCKKIGVPFKRYV